MKITSIKAWQVDLPIKEGRYKWSNNNFVDVLIALWLPLKLMMV